MNASFSKVRLDILCKKHHIKKLSFFGSVLREDFGPNSDIDILVEFREGTKVGFFKLYEIEQDFSRLFGGRKIDLLTERSINHRLQPIIQKEAKVQYVEEG